MAKHYKDSNFCMNCNEPIDYCNNDCFDEEHVEYGDEDENGFLGSSRQTYE